MLFGTYLIDSDADEFLIPNEFLLFSLITYCKLEKKNNNYLLGLHLIKIQGIECN